MNFDYSTETQVKQAKIELESAPKPICEGCSKGIKMCKRTPCMGTVEDIEKMMAVGYSKNLMLDWWGGTGLTGEHIRYYNPFKEDVIYLVPAIIGYEGKKSPLMKLGTCNLLTSDNKCSMHSLDLKPIQGRISCCKGEELDNDNDEEAIDERIHILHTWNTQKGRDLINKWKQEVGYNSTEPDSFEMPADPLDQLNLLMTSMLRVLKMSEDRE